MSIKKYIEKIEGFSGKKIIIAGATAGIGLELAKQLLSKNAQLVIMARNLAKTDKVKSSLLEQHPNGMIDIVEYDQSDYEKIDNAAQVILKEHSDFYALVANAGILAPNKEQKSKQNNPLTIETNFLGLRRFLDQICRTCTQKRFIFQGSLVAGSHISKKTNIFSDKYSLMKQYAISKSCVEALWYQYYTSDKNNEYILVEPGIAITDIIRNFIKPIRVLANIFAKIFTNSASKAALPSLKALTSKAKNGDYYVPRGLFTIMGYPKKKKFPKKRKREFLLKY